MEPILSLRNRAEFYHRQLTEEARRDLSRCGISDTLIAQHRLGWNGKKITVPVFNRHGDVASLVLVTLSAESSSETRAGRSAPELYGWDTLRRRPARLVVADSITNRLVLEAHGFPAVASTGGARHFSKEWTAHFEGTEHVYVCFGRGKREKAAARRIAKVLEQARVVELPEDVGEKGDVSDFFVRLKRTRSQFEALLRNAELQAKVSHGTLPGHRFAKRAERLKSEVPIARVIARYTRLVHSGEELVGRCPLHEDRRTSLHVYPDKNTFRCLGCRATGDAIAFLEKREALTFGQAVARLEKIRYEHA